MPDFTLHTYDYMVIAGYVIVILWIGLRVSRNTHDTEDYFLASRSLSWPLIGLSLLASNMSSTSLIGMAGSAYSIGISVFNYEWMAAIVLIFFTLFLLPLLLNSRVYTMPEFLERRYDRRARFYFSAFTILGNIFIDTAGALYAGALVIFLLYPEIPFALSVIILAILAGVYTILGGLKAVVYTDTIQAILLLLGALLISALAFGRLDYSWQTVANNVDASMLRLIQPIDDPFLPWPGLLFGVPLLGFYFWCTNQFMVQRVLGARNLDHGRWGALLAGFLKLPMLFIMVMPGIFALFLYPDLPSLDAFTPDIVFPVLLFDLLPSGLRGLILVALIAAIMSSIDSTLNAASTLVTMDFTKLLKPAWNEQQLLLAGRITTFIFMLIAAIWAPIIADFPSLWVYLQSILAYQSPPFVAALLLGIFWGGAHRQAAFWGLIGGHLLSTLLFVANMIFGVIDIHFLYVAPILFVFSSLLIMVISLIKISEHDRTSIEGLLWKANTYKQESKALMDKAWYQNYRIQSAIILAITLLLLIGFW
ncbi:sodium:solute symporter [Nitrosomonas halophila]|uniref:Solute:Na+ symporter, SSS family n=1 Tax=Nitrosomonas halophila TaxID=44576 RepID=A0A1H3HXE0_9PROT|nr:sodium:solute symporter [Nitrosomonas halophila]SDY19419.1 solute:Na+ symporter, SSS family [Nitrosomonas halophila]